MKARLFNNLLLFSLFGITLGFFGVLYEGVVYGPKFLDTSIERMLFWKSFTSVISPIPFYIPWDPLAAVIALTLFFITSKQQVLIKKQLKWASIFQIASLVLTFYILFQINFKQSFGNLEKYAAEIPFKVILFNILSICRISFAAIAMSFAFKAYIQTQKVQI
jgi:hypothetical protein